METRIYNNLALHGALVMSVNESGFPDNPAIGTIIVKDYCIYAYIRVGGLETWYPFASRTSSYVHVQGLDSLTWIVNHNLGTENVWFQVKDPSGNIVQVGKTNIDVNSFQLNFTQACKGTVVVVAPDTIDVPSVNTTAINVAGSAVVIDSSGVRVAGNYVLTDMDLTAALADTNAAAATAQAAADTASADLAAEVTRAQAAESDLQGQINSVLSNVDPAALDSLTEVVAAFQAADSSLNGAITALSSDAVSKTGNELPLTNAVMTSDSVTAASTAKQTIASTTVASARSVKYLVQVSYNSNYHITEIMVVQNGSQAYMSEYGTIMTGGSLASFDANIVGGNLCLQATPTNSGAVFKIAKLAIMA